MRLRNWLMVRRLRQKYGKTSWAVAQGGFLCHIEVVDCRRKAHPDTYRLGVVAQEGTTAEKANELCNHLGKSAGALILYKTSAYDDQDTDVPVKPTLIHAIP